MQLNRKLQYAILFALYISRGGRVTISGAAEGLNISKSFLEQIARQLRIGGIVKSVRGPSGGYELNGNPTVRDIFQCIDSVNLLSLSQLLTYVRGSQEERAFLNLTSNLLHSMNPVLNRKIKNVMNELVVNEMAKLDKLTTKSLEN